MNTIETIKAEIERRMNFCNGIYERDKEKNWDMSNYYHGKAVSLGELLSFLDTLKEQPVCEDVRKEKSLSLQIQAYLNTCSDELYAEGKPLHSEYRQKEIHDCMAMWKKLHDYFFYNKPFQSVSEELEEEIERMYLKDTLTLRTRAQYADLARHFYNLGRGSSEKPNDHKGFPTTDEEMEEFLKNTPPVELPDKYKTPDWLFKQEKSEIPTNLDEAEFRYVESSNIPPANQEEEKMVYDAFKAGAMWDRKQFVCIGKHAVDELTEPDEIYIRKKDE